MELNSQNLNVNLDHRMSTVLQRLIRSSSKLPSESTSTHFDGQYSTQLDDFPDVKSDESFTAPHHNALVRRSSSTTMAEVGAGIVIGAPILGAAAALAAGGMVASSIENACHGRKFLNDSDEHFHHDKHERHESVTTEHAPRALNIVIGE